ncbi:MAG: hypothetical protein HY282_11690 [Nitrospirae bacterium]|nr:hypothetical protein [Candidatus Manganitrophaceae bacterium]
MKRPIYPIMAGGLLLSVSLIAAPIAGPVPSSEATTHLLLMKSGVENTSFTQVTLPLFQGRRLTDTVWYVVTESSNEKDAIARGVNFSPKLANTKGTPAAQKVTVTGGIVNFNASVDFTPVHSVTPGPTGFPPLAAQYGSVGDPGYTPLIELPDGTVLNAPHLANKTGQHDKVLSINFTQRKVVLRETEGRYAHKPVHYVSFDATDPGVAALEGSTYAPALNAAPGIGRDDLTSARSPIVPFANGQTGATNPDRQGLSSALMGDGDPLNVLEVIPLSAGYSPLWDAFLSFWTPSAVASKQNYIRSDFYQISGLAAQGLITGPGGATWGAVGIIINCPVISVDH